MKFRFPLTLALLTTLSLPALAHDPKLHQQEGAKAADCSKMKGMDMSKMDPNDPITKAMNEKCKSQMDHGDGHDHMAGHDMKDMPADEMKSAPPSEKEKK